MIQTNFWYFVLCSFMNVNRASRSTVKENGPSPTTQGRLLKRLGGLRPRADTHSGSAGPPGRGTTKSGHNAHNPSVMSGTAGENTKTEGRHADDLDETKRWRKEMGGLKAQGRKWKERRKIGKGEAGGHKRAA